MMVPRSCSNSDKTTKMQNPESVEGYQDTARRPVTSQKRKPTQKASVPYAGPGAELYQRYPREMAALRNAVSNSREVKREQFSQSFQGELFNSYVAQAERILGTKEYTALSSRDREEAQFSKSALEKLEHEEKKVDDL